MTPHSTRKPSSERRREIGEAALRIIGEQGLTALTTTAIANEIGVTSGALFRHFASRDEILEEAARQALARLESTFPEPGLPPRERLLTLARNRVALLSSEPGIAWLLRSDQAYLTLPDSAARAIHEMVERSRQTCLECLRQGAADGTIRDDIEPEMLAVTVIGTVLSLVRMPGVRQLAPARPLGDTDAVLDALMRLLSPR